MSHSFWHGFSARNTVRKYGITILGVIIALALVLGAAGLYWMNAAATGPSAAEARVQAWVTQLGTEELTPARHLAQEHLEQAGDSSVDPLIAALHSPNAAMRRNSAQMLGFIAVPRARAALTALMKNDPVASVRSRAAWSLGELHDMSAARDLEIASALDTDPDVRQQASGSLDALRSYLAEVAGKDGRITGAFAVAPSQPSVIYLAAMGRISVSRDGGKSWSPSGSNLPSRATALAVSPSSPNIVYAGTESMGLFESTDGGATWNARNQDLGLNPGLRITVTAIAIDPQAPERIFIATGEWVGSTQAALTPLDILSSSDSGDTWQRVTAQETEIPAQRLVIVGNSLYSLAGENVTTWPL